MYASSDFSPRNKICCLASRSAIISHLLFPLQTWWSTLTPNTQTTYPCRKLWRASRPSWSELTHIYSIAPPMTTPTTSTIPAVTSMRTDVRQRDRCRCLKYSETLKTVPWVVHDYMRVYMYMYVHVHCIKHDCVAFTCIIPRLRLPCSQPSVLFCVVLMWWTLVIPARAVKETQSPCSCFQTALRQVTL